MMSGNYPNKTLLQFSNDPADSWTVDDAMKGISIMGGTGSGKTTASGKKIATTLLKQGWGGLVLCAKSDEAALWQSYCREAGREDDLIIFGKGATFTDGSEFVFNPIDYEMKREGEGAGETLNLTNIFMSIYRMGNRIAGESDTKEERYWDTALKRCLNRVIELIKLSGEDLTYKNMVKILSTSHKLEGDKYTDMLTAAERGKLPIESLKSNNYCGYCLMKAYYNTRADDTAEADSNAYDLVEDYFLYALPGMGSKTKSVVIESFMGLAEPFLSGLLHRHFSGTTNMFPEWTYKYNKVIVLDFPIKEFLDTGIMAQCVFKLLFQQAIERRDISEHPNPVFLCADEAHYFINPYDQIFLTTARSSRAITVYLSQNISNYLAVMGSGSDAKARVDSLMGNLSTKIFHANADAETNEYASRLIGNDILLLGQVGRSHGLVNFEITQTQGLNSQFLPQVQPRRFTVLKTGGLANDFDVEAVVVVTGKKWSGGNNYLETTFIQDFK